MTRMQFYGGTVGAALALILLMRWVNQDSGVDVVEAQIESTPVAENRLLELRKAAATVPAKDALNKKALADLALREKNLLKADNLEQAKIALLQRVQDVGRANQIDIRGAQEFKQRQLSPDYGEVTATVAFNCDIMQLVNFLAAVGNQPEALATDEIHVAAGPDRKKKTISVRLSVGAAVPRKMLPEKKG